MYKFLFPLIVLFTSCAINKKEDVGLTFEGEQVGCGNFIVFKLSEDGKEYISIAFNANEIEYKSFQAFGVDKSELVKVNWKKFDGDISQSLCNDVMQSRPDMKSNLTAESGLVEIIISENDLEKAKNSDPYKVTLNLKNIRFGDAKIKNLKVEDVNVGWLPG